MFCPNCGQETVNINGRHVCLDCGIEVTSSPVPEPKAADVTESSSVQQTPQVKVEPATHPVQEEILPDFSPEPPLETSGSDIASSTIAVPEVKEATISNLQEQTLEKVVSPVAMETAGLPDLETPLSQLSQNENTQDSEVLAPENGTTFSEPFEDAASSLTSELSAVETQKQEEKLGSFDSEKEIEELLKPEVKVDSGNPIFETMNAKLDQNQSNNMDTVVPVAPPKMEEPPQPTSLPAANSTDIQYNFFNPSQTPEAGEMEVMAATPMSNGTIQKIIIITSISFVAIILAVILILKREAIVNIFDGNKTYTPEESLDSPLKQPFDGKGDGESVGEVE